MTPPAYTPRRRKARFLTRPRTWVIVVLAALFALYYYNNLRWKLAIAELEDVSRDIQRFCNRHQRCPETPRGWTPGARPGLAFRDNMRYMRRCYPEAGCTSFTIIYKITGGRIQADGNAEQDVAIHIPGGS